MKNSQVNHFASCLLPRPLIKTQWLSKCRNEKFGLWLLDSKKGVSGVSFLFNSHYPVLLHASGIWLTLCSTVLVSPWRMVLLLSKTCLRLKKISKPGVVAHVCHPSTGEAEARRFWNLGGIVIVSSRPVWATQQDPVKKRKEERGEREREGYE